MEELVISAMKRTNSLVMISNVGKDLPVLNTKFAVRDGIYKFDAEVLRGYTELYSRTVDKLARANRDSLDNTEDTIGSEDTKDKKSKLEELLDDLTQKASIADVRSILILAFSGESISDINKAFSDMSDTGETKYRALMR